MEPSRISWAMPRASLRSVLTGIALNASRTAGSRAIRPATLHPACPHITIATAGWPRHEEARGSNATDDDSSGAP